MESQAYLAAQFWLLLATWIISAGAAVYAYWMGRTRARRDDVDKSIGELEDRVTTVERDQYHTPTHQDLGRVYERLNETNNALAELTGKLGSLATSLGRVESYLLNHRRSGD